MYRYLVFLVQMKEPMIMHAIMKTEYINSLLLNIISSWRVVPTQSAKTTTKIVSIYMHNWGTLCIYIEGIACARSP